MIIHVYGPGCMKCSASADVAKAFLRTNGLEGEVVKITDLATIAEHGILRTPGVVIDGETVVEGRILREKDLAAWLARREG